MTTEDTESTERATPETDAAQCEGLLRTNPIPMQVVTANFARKLERERDEAREEAEYYKLKERPKNPKWYNGREIPAEIKEETK